MPSIAKVFQLQFPSNDEGARKAEAKKCVEDFLALDAPEGEKNIHQLRKMAATLQEVNNGLEMNFANVAVRLGDDLGDEIQQLETRAANLEVCLEHMNSKTQKASKRQHPRSSSEPVEKAHRSIHTVTHSL